MSLFGSGGKPLELFSKQLVKVSSDFYCELFLLLLLLLFSVIHLSRFSLGNNDDFQDKNL